MLRITGNVTYTDGRTVDFAGGPIVFAEWELYAHKNGLPSEHKSVPVLQAAFIAYTCIHRGVTKQVTFDEWRATVDDVQASVNQADPTAAASAA